MKHQHLTHEILAAVAEKRMDMTQLAVFLLEHVGFTCIECRAVLDDYTDQLEANQLEESFGPAAERLREAIEEAQRLHAEMEPRARRDLAELLALDPCDRRDRVRRARRRFRSAALVRLLLEECRARVADDPHGAVELAALALEVILRLPGEPYPLSLVRDLTASAYAQRCNAWRAAGELVAADQDLVRAERAAKESADPLVHGEVFRVGASLRKDQRRFQEAEDFLDRALAVYREIEDSTLAGRVLINKASLHEVMGDPATALETVTTAIQELGSETTSRLYLCAQHNRAHYLCNLGRFDEARRVLVEHTALYQRFPEFTIQLRLQWVEGKIAQGLGELEQAEALFERVRDGFLKRGIGCHAAVASLYLALVHLDQGRLEEVKRVAEEMVPIFRAQDVHREAIAALLIFQRAAAAETVTRELLRELVAYLERAKDDPVLRYERPS
jgi:tetratricopeptide (TPR) repeat protein